MKRVGACVLIVSTATMTYAIVVGRLAAQQGPRAAVPSSTKPLAPITIDYPAEGSVFPPEIPAPTFLWRDANEDATFWHLNIAFDGRVPAIEVKLSGEPMRIGEIDPRCVTETNNPMLTPQQAATHTWTPDAGTWAAIKKYSEKRAATVTITGFRQEDPNRAVSRGQVKIRTSKDPVGAPIFYRDVPLMPTEGEKGVIKPLPQSAIGLISWRLRNVGESQSRTLMEGLPTCANCHSFSRDGKTLGLDVDGPQNDKGLYALVNVKRETSIRNEDVIQWSSFGDTLGGKLRAAFSSQVSPDGRYVVTTIDDAGARNRVRGRELVDKYYVANFKDHRFLQVFFPTRGILAWYSRETGRLRPLSGADDPRYVQTDGVWSPDGKYIVFARAEAKDPFPEAGQPAEYANDPNETQVQYDLYRIPFNDGKGGRPERIAGASENGMSNNFPKVSPDGRWIVFVRCRNGQLMRPDSELYIVPFKGGRERRMNCNTSLMNSWHSFSPNGRWMVFSSKSRSPFTQMYLTHVDANGNDTPAILVDNAAAANRAVNIPEFVNIPPDGLLKIDTPAMDFFRVFDLAVDLMRRNQLDAAVTEWKRAAGLNPDDARVFFNLALTLERKGQISEAIPQYQKALEINPDNSGACTNLGIALARTGKLGEAIDRFAKCLAISPGSAKAHSNLGSALMQAGRIEEATQHLRKALDFDPEFPDANYSLGLVLGETGRRDEGIFHLQKAVAASPDDFECRYNLGCVLAATGRFNEAISHLEQAVRLSGGREPLSLDMLSAAYSEVGRFVEAVQAARRALDLATEQNNQDLASALKARIAAYETNARAP